MEYKELTDYEKEIINQIIQIDKIDNENYSCLFTYSKGAISALIKNDAEYHYKRIMDFFIDNDFMELWSSEPAYKLLDFGKKIFKGGTIQKYYEKDKTPQETLNEKIEKRYKLLTVLYIFTNGATKHYVDLKGLAERDLIYDSDFDSSYRWLLDKNFISIFGTGYTVYLAPDGRDEIEKRFSVPDNAIIEAPKAESKIEQHQHFYGDIKDSNLNLNQSLDSKDSKSEQTITVPQHKTSKRKNKLLLILKILGAIVSITLIAVKIYNELNK